MMTATLSALVNKYNLKGQTLGDVALGAVIKHSRDWNLARESVIGSGLSLKTPAFDLQRACGTSIEACIQIANKIALGQIDAGIAGGTDSISDTPIVYRDNFRKNLLDIYNSKSVMKKIALTGGVFQNKFLTKLVSEKLINEGYQVLKHSKIPANDGGLSFGQALVAIAQLNEIKNRVGKRQ